MKSNYYRKALIVAAVAIFCTNAGWSSVSGTAHAQTPATVGQWSLGPVWDITPVNMLVLPSGKVMFYPGLTVPGDDARLWDPGTNVLTSLAKAGYDLFCTGHTFLTDGTILFTGGTLTRPNTGIAYASIYNPVTDVWTRVPDMTGGRWYPSTTITGTGEVLVTSGWVDNVQHENPLSQVWQPSSGTWRSLTTAMLKFWMYSMVYWAPSGKAIIVGPDRPTYYLDIAGTGTLTSPTSFNYASVRDYGSSVMYSSSKILIAGGGDPPTNTAEIFDLNVGTWQYTNPMVNKRRQFNLVLLPDDNVLAVGGTSGPGFNDQTSPVYASEMWNTSTKAWTTMASQTVGRFYHSVAVLLPDGRVLSGGGTDMYQTEIYSPPYLFKGARPTVTSAPSAVPYSAPFFVGTPNATSIATVRLIRLPANTHAFDQNQRIIPISFTQATGGLNLTPPSDPNQAPPGHYMLFILNGSGVPSVAKIIQLGVAATPPAAPSGLVATAASGSTINLTWVSNSTNETSFKIERALGAGAFSQVATVGAGVTSYADSGLAVSTNYSYRVRASNTAGDSAYSNTASATTLAGGTTPAAPTGLAAAAASSSAINVTWTDQSTNETGFKIERALGAGAFSQVGTVGANVTSYADSGLTASTSYSYRVRATNSGGDSAYSNTASATTASGGTSGSFDMSLVSLDSGFAYFSSQNFGTPPDSSTCSTCSMLRIFENGVELGPAHSSHANIRTLGAGRFSHWQFTDGSIGLEFSASNNTNPKTNGKTYTYQVGSSPPPAAPTGLVATATSSTSINLTWTDQSTNETSFKIERALGAGAFSQVGTVGAGVITYADSGLTAGTNYSYRVRASNTGGDSAYSNTATATTTVTAPAAPSSLSATAASSTAINLTWVSNSTNETSFKIERALGAGAFSQVGTVGAGVITYADSGLTAGTNYSYRVRASNTGGDSAYSNTATATTTVTAPAAPSSLSATAASSTAINLTWVDQSTNEDTFKIERALGAGAFSQVGTVGAGVITYADSGLTAGTNYSYRVRASNTGGDSAYSNTASATTGVAVPTAPSSLSATAASSTAINLTWVSNSTNETSFKIERALGAGAFSQVGTVGAGVITYADSGLTAGTNYSYRVRASNTGGDSAYSNTANATTFPPPPTAPSGLAATTSLSTSMTLTWVDQSSNEDTFKIERALGAGAFSQVGTVGPNITTYSDTGLTAGTSYSYRVRASNTGGDSAYSNTATATTLPSSPAAPTGLSATAASSTSVNLTWADQSTNEDTFKVERALGAGAFSQVGTVGPNITTYTDTGLTPATSYSYRVRASNTGGDSTYSNTTTTTTGVAAPAAPSGASATAASSTSITVTWVDQSTNEDTFRIERALGAGAFSQVGTVGPNITTYTDTGLTASTSYSYRVRASNTGGDSTYSNTTTATTGVAAPAAPSGASATAASSTSITVTWVDQSTNEDTFRIERALGAGAFSQVGTVGPNITTYTDTGLTASTSYSYRVRASNTGGDSAYSNTTTATTGVAAPAAPSGASATAASSTSITVTWVDQSTNEDTFKIERALGAGAFSQVGTVGPNVTTYSDTGLTAGTSYSYRVRASNTGGDSAYSNTASATTLPTSPSPPSGLTATAASSTSITVTWIDQSTNEDTFKIERALGAGAFSQVATVGPNITTYSDAGLTAGTSYSYRVRASNTGGDSAYSNTASATTGPTAPAAPSGLSATAASSTSITVTWVDQSTNEDTFKIERALGAGAFSQVATVGPNITTYSDTGLTAGTTYSYRVRSSNTVADSAYSNTASATTGVTAPAPPSGTGATATSSTSITITWVDQSTDEDMFKIERALGAGAFSQVATVGPNLTTYTDTGLAAGTAYSYRVRASNAGGDSAYSNTASATTAVASPAAPSGLSATAASSTSVNLTWVDQSTNEDTFKIERALGAGAFSQVGTVGPNVTTYSDTGLTAGTAYSYRVRASNTGGDSAYSNTATATTGVATPTAPSGASATVASSTSITLTWVDQSTNEDTFKIERALGAGAFSQVASVGPNVTTYTDTGLTASTSYSYRVRASNTGGDSPYSNTTTATTGVAAPAAPSGASATAASSTSITVTWVDQSANEDTFKIERALGAGAFSQVGTVGPNITTYADSGLIAGTSYSYRVRAANTGGDSAYSNTASATTSATAPAAPSGLTATAAFSTSINLTWTDQSTNEDTFKVERALGAGAFSQVGTVGPNITTYADSGLIAGTSYSYRVRASNTGGDSAYSNTATATTLPSSPGAPSGLTATAASTTSISLTWVDQSTNEDTFKIERALGAGAFSQVATVGPNITTYADSGLTAGTSYSYRVRASNTGGDSAYSNTATATTVPTAPAAPSGLSATAASSTSITLSWTDQSTNETSFKIERALGAGAFSQVGTVGAGVTTYADTGLTAGTSYSYRVRASNSGGDSAYSNTASATTLPTLPAAPTGLVATAVSRTQIDLTWVDQANNENGFKIERKDGGGSFAEIATVGPNVTTYADTGLTRNTRYTYRVRAYNSAGNSAYSNTDSDKTNN